MGKALEGKTINSRYFGDTLTGHCRGLRTLVDMVIADKQYFPGDILNYICMTTRPR